MKLGVRHPLTSPVLGTEFESDPQIDAGSGPGGYPGLLPVSASLRILIFMPDPRVTRPDSSSRDWEGTVVEIVYERVAAIDVGKKEVAVTVRIPGHRLGNRTQQTRKFRTFYQVLRQMVDWLVCQGVTHVTMEATGVY